MTGETLLIGLTFSACTGGVPAATSGYDGTEQGAAPPAVEDVWMMRADGSQQRNLTSNPLEDDSFPAWSPDGSWIIFSRYGQLRIVARDGAGSQPLANSPGTDGFPDWTA
jgi:Tol biopolymer transport system component